MPPVIRSGLCYGIYCLLIVLLITGHASARSMVISCDNVLKSAFVNGNPISLTGPNNGAWTATDTYTVTDDVILSMGIECYDSGGVAGIIASLSNSGPMTETTNWKCTNSHHDWWFTNDYDDSAWEAAVPIAQTNGAWGTSFDGDQSAWWIWTWGYNGEHTTAFCRYTIPPVNGNWGDWGEWSDCSATCGSRTRTHTRECNDPPKAYGGADCVGDSTESEECAVVGCPVDGNWGTWGEYGSCTATCGDRTQTRTRECNDPPKAHGGADCVGEGSQTEQCTFVGCPVDGNWGDWGEWSDCSATCGSRTRTHTRECNDPPKAYGGADCVGESTETEECTVVGCPVDGNWGTWGAYGSCTATCGDRTQTRTRECNDPPKAHGGADCVGEGSETEQCTFVGCPVDGNWGDWGAWGSCSTTCGSGTTRTHTRMCDNPAKAYGGADCTGPDAEREGCSFVHCPIDGGWGNWTDWGPCYPECGEDRQQNRTRDCDDPEPQYQGADCQGSDVDYANCDVITCPEPPLVSVDGGWSTWGDYTSCSVSCGIGYQVRIRTCTDPAPRLFGDPCRGEAHQAVNCNPGACTSCAAGEVLCNDGGCKYGSYCDGYSDCADGSDEQQDRCNNPDVQQEAAEREEQNPLLNHQKGEEELEADASKQKADLKSMTPFIGAGGGFLALVMVTCLAVYLCKRRKRKQEEEDEQDIISLAKPDKKRTSKV